MKSAQALRPIYDPTVPVLEAVSDAVVPDLNMDKSDLIVSFDFLIGRRRIFVIK